ncbi:MAG: hypothetical protein D6766_04590 [Verrucomicrobia bacterium]|nr:MAG: hypothetical protein D6766_04590 [Verrucomicrobiota bacterium]
MEVAVFSLTLVDGGFSVQYSPLLEYREGASVVLFCQLDVAGRTEREPVAERLRANLLNYLAAWKPRPERQALYSMPADRGQRPASRRPASGWPRPETLSSRSRF